jgi:two-component system cell cycle sensor histidine kinase/response regulator CckA
MLRRMIGEDISLRMVLRASRATVRADRGQLEQVIVNLVVNARDAMPGGGTLSLHTSRRRIDDAELGIEPGDYVELAVVDTGIGVDEDIRDRIFEPFFTTKDVNKGTGLGLATVYGIVAQSRGTVTFDSKRGQGSTFRVLLPITTDAARTGAPECPTQSERSSKGRVLLIEDERMVRVLVKRALEHLGYAVSDATDGADALAYVSGEHEPFDLVVTDVIMPTISGRAVVERLREHQPELPALFISGYPEEHMTGVPLDGTAPNAFLAKPFSVHDLLVALEDLTQRTRAPDRQNGG